MKRLDSLSGIQDLPDQEPLDTFGVVRGVAVKTTKSGDPFVDLQVGDAHCAVAAKVWARHDEALSTARRLKVGDAVKVRGKKSSFRGAAEIDVHQLRIVAPDDDEYDATVLFGEGARLVQDKMCRTLVFDIETVPGVTRRELPNTVAEALATYADRKDSEPEKVMGLSPFFGKVVSLAFGDGDSEEPPTVLVVPREESDLGDDVPDNVRATDEAGLLHAFWSLARYAETVVTYNGRGFDVPFLVGRSLAAGVPASVDLMSNRWSLRPHLDLFDVLGQQGRGPSKLDVVCWALGIASPKGAMDGSMVAPAYERGAILEIAEYNAQDVLATARVYRRVRDGVLRYRSDW